MQAFILEALRWRPVNPIGKSIMYIQDHLVDGIPGLPHRATKDIIWVCPTYYSQIKSDFITEWHVHPCWCHCLRKSLVSTRLIFLKRFLTL